MDFPDEWQNFETNRAPDAVPASSSSGPWNLPGQNGSPSHDTRQDQPLSTASRHEVPQYRQPIVLLPPQNETQSEHLDTVATSQDHNQNGEESWDVGQNLDRLFETPKPEALSGWTGSGFNKPNDGYGNTMRSLMTDEELEQSRSFERYRLHSVTFELNQGDVLVFVDYPNYRKEAISHTDCNGLIYKSQQFRVHSRKLLETKSSVFEDMLGPTYQFKIQRRRKMVNKMPEGVKYLLDLTPPSEGDELVFQMTELSLTPALIKWWRSYIENGTDMCLVSGHDDVCLCSRQPKSSKSEDEDDIESPDGEITEITEDAHERRIRRHRAQRSTAPCSRIEKALRRKARGENEFFATPSYRNIPDYCPVRHRNGIIRLLMLIEGKGVILDSAPRMWTLVKLGNIFECSAILRDRVTQWIFHGYNPAFVEVAPEEALQIAFSLKIPEVAESAFRILVNELALKLTDDGSHQCNQTTVFGRRLGNLPDELSNLVQHAAQAFVERVSDIDKMMRNPRLYDFWDIDEWNGLRIIEQLLERENENTELASEALGALRILMDALVSEATQAWHEVMSTRPAYNHLTYKSIDQDRLTYMELQDFENATMIMLKFTSTQMLLCAAPYNEVGAILDGRRWNLCRCKLAGHKHKTYNTLVQDATKALATFLACNPKLETDDLWTRTLKLTNNEYPKEGTNSLFNRPIVSLDHLEAEVKDRLRPITLSWVRRKFELPLSLTRHLLLTLTDNELKYLPLWCGGCDDGTGGVFEDPIPSTDMGPKGPGPGYHTGQTIPSAPASISGSMIEDMETLRVWGSTTGASTNVQDSISTVYRPDEVIAEDKSIASESFTIGGSEYSDARYAIPAGHQEMGEAIDMTVDTMDESADTESRSATEGRSIASNDSDDDMYMWDDDYDSDGSTHTIS